MRPGGPVVEQSVPLAVRGPSYWLLELAGETQTGIVTVSILHPEFEGAVSVAF
jgi:hypothetical protein